MDNSRQQVWTVDSAYELSMPVEEVCYQDVVCF